MSVLGTQSWPEVPQTNVAAFTQYASSSSQVSLLTGSSVQPKLSPPFFDRQGACAKFWGGGIFSVTGTPTWTFALTVSSTQGLGTFGTNIGQSAAISALSGVTNKIWRFEVDLTVFTPGDGAAACTISCIGNVWSPAGFASPFNYSLSPGGGDSATLTATLDGKVVQYFNWSVTCSASSGSNTMTMQNFYYVGWN